MGQSKVSNVLITTVRLNTRGVNLDQFEITNFEIANNK